MSLQKELSFHANAGGLSQSVSISSTSAATVGLVADNVVIYSTVDCFMRAGASPTALATGVDQFVPAATMLRVTIPTAGWQLAFKTSSASGTVYVNPGA